jgi:hypothetical protein
VAVALWLTMVLIISAVAEVEQDKVLQRTEQAHFARLVALALKVVVEDLRLLTTQEILLRTLWQARVVLD